MLRAFDGVICIPDYYALSILLKRKVQMENVCPILVDVTNLFILVDVTNLFILVDVTNLFIGRGRLVYLRSRSFVPQRGGQPLVCRVQWTPLNQSN